MSLAIADLLVSLLVMPFALIVELYGQYLYLYLFIDLHVSMFLFSLHGN